MDASAPSIEPGLHRETLWMPRVCLEHYAFAGAGLSASAPVSLLHTRGLEWSSGSTAESIMCHESTPWRKCNPSTSVMEVCSVQTSIVGSVRTPASCSPDAPMRHLRVQGSAMDPARYSQCPCNPIPPKYSML